MLLDGPGWQVALPVPPEVFGVMMMRAAQGEAPHRRQDNFAHQEPREAWRPTLDAQRDGLYFKTNAKAGCP